MSNVPASPGPTDASPPRSSAKTPAKPPASPPAQARASRTFPARSWRARSAAVRREATRTRVLVVDATPGQAAGDHPQVRSWLKRGWTLKSTRPRIAPGGAKLLVVLSEAAA